MVDLNNLKNNNNALQNQMCSIKQNYIHNTPLDDFIFNKIITRVDPIEYCHNVLRAHLPEKKRYLHENQIALVRAVANPHIRQVAALMSRQAGKTESIASFCGYLADNYPGLAIGIFTPKIQQAQVSIGRISIFYQMNEDKLNNKIIACNRDVIKLSNNSKIQAVSGSDQSNIEGLTFDIIILDEAQKISDYTWSERITPMGGATNAKLIQIGTPKFRNHFYEAFQNKEICHVVRDWTECPQLWANDAKPLILPDYKDPTHTKTRRYPRYAFGLMPKVLKQQLFPNNPEAWTDGQMSVEDFKTQYMLEFVDGAGSFLTTDEVNLLRNGDFDWIESGVFGERYVAGIDFAGSSADGADFTHITVLRISPQGQKQKVWSMEMQGESYPDQMRMIVHLFGGPKPKWHVQSIFADYTGCGAPVIQTLKMEYGLRNLTGIIFNSSDIYTHSGMNMKNVMYAEIKNDIDRELFKYPNKEKFNASAGADNAGFYRKMIDEWGDLEYEAGNTINKKIQAPTGLHDDCPSADVLANFAANHGNSSGFGVRPSGGRIFRA